ncbi:phage terminase small subunit [Methylovorus glucosotrophus]|uniref:terminase small subunit n=1 Tax=Methylovorus glucosotrophus TaxID=266009 RepID=UPI001331C136|nr:terminase small subunit [Methylovorus glucosotrophus]KAF0844337.1 phage terminase small subunit [Methylovorus glucosotrophus]
MAEKKLTPKQAMFVQEYLIDLNATQAAIRAGYSEKTANEQGARLLANVSVRSKVDELMKDREKRTEITQDYVIKGIVETIERCRQAEAVFDRSGERVLVETPTGEIAPAFTFDAKNVLRGFELLGKHLAMWTEKQELTGKDGKDLIPQINIVTTGKR